MDQVTPVEHRPLAPSATPSALNGLAEQVAAVESARTKLGQDLDRLNAEVQAQMSRRLEKTAWKAVGTSGAILASLMARKLVTAAWTKTRKTDPPSNPAAPGTSWGEALAWAAISGLVVAVGRLLAQRGAAAGWKKTLGSLPPGLEEVT
jgi:hypothetical protein